MATLNTLRTRGALFLSIVIGVALLAFLLGDLTSASSIFQGRRNRVGSIDGNNVDYQEFAVASDNQERVMESIYGRSSLSAEEVDRVNDMVWETFVRRYSLDPGFRRLGLAAGEAEQIDMVRGAYPSPVLMSLFASPETGTIDRTALAGFVDALGQDASGQMGAAWDYIKDQMSSERISSKYLALVQGGLFVNDLEVARGMEVANNSYTGNFARVPYSSVADSLVPVMTSEVRKYYAEHKGDYRRSASREIEYVAWEIAPSEADFADAAAHMETVAAEFAAAPDPMQYATMNSQERPDIRYYSESQLPLEYAAIAFGDRRGEVEGPTLTGNVYTAARVAGERMMPDSVGARHILLPIGSTATADSIAGALKGGADFSELASVYMPGGAEDLGVFAPETMVGPFAEAVTDARVGEVFTVDTQFGKHVVEMTYRSPAVRKAQVAVYTYNVEPSAGTEQTAYAGARDFLAAASGSKEKFDEAVTSTSANRRVATINQSDRNVVGLANSRELVRWSFNSKPGTVSPIFEIDDNYVVAVLADAKEAGIADVRDISTSIAQVLRNDKKMALISEQIAGLSIDRIAEMEGASKGEVSGLITNSFYDAALGAEPAPIGAFLGLAQGTLSKPIEGYSAVYVVQPTSIETTAEATDASTRVLLEANAETSLPQRIMQALNEQSDIKDYRARFF